MRTTIDLPDDLFRRAKATAALQGKSLKELVASVLEKGLPREAEKFGHDEPFPIEIRNLDARFFPKTNADIFELLDSEDDRTLG